MHNNWIWNILVLNIYTKVENYVKNARKIFAFLDNA